MKYRSSAVALAARANIDRFVRVSLLVLGLLLSALIAVGPVAPAHSAPQATVSQEAPDKVVADFHAALLQSMKNAKDYQRRYDTLGSAMAQAFDFESMTRIAVGPKWSTLQPDQQAALVDSFRRFSVATYASQFDSYSGERFETTNPGEAAPQGVIVATVLQPAQGSPIKFNYLLHRTAAGWRIIDIYLDGTISQLAVRRSEFSSVLAQSGPEGLAQLLDQKTKKLAIM